MSDETVDSDGPPAPWNWLRRALRQAWRDTKSVYYANTPIWRVLKSAGLLFLGLFCWTGANLLLSYQPEWGFLWYVMAYGFALLFWGPLTHLVIVPLVIRTRRTETGRVARVISRHGSKINLTTFVVVVILLGTFPIGPMTFDFQLPAVDDPEPDVDPDLQCTKTDELVHCQVSDPRGIDRVVVTSGDRTVATDDDEPFDVEFRIDELAEVRDQREFAVELQDEDERTLRRYVRTVEQVPDRHV